MWWLSIFTKKPTNMKKLMLAGLTLFSAFSFATAQNAEKLNPGDKMPGADVVMKSATGNDMALKNAKGKNGTLVMFSCNTCPFVVKNQTLTKKAMDFAKSHEVGMAILNSNEAKRSSEDSYEAMQKYAMSQNYSVPYMIDQDSKLADLFGASHTPEIYLFDKEGKLVYKGALSDNPGDPSASQKMFYQTAIEALVAGHKIDPATTKSIGCSIKRKS
jgi:thioredoxin-related protein